MAAPELELISKLVGLGSISPELFQRLAPEVFVQTPEAALMYEYIQKWAEQHHLRTPSREWINEQFPKVGLPNVPMRSLDELVEKVVTNMLAYSTQKSLEQFDALTESEGIVPGLEYLHKRIGHILQFTGSTKAVRKDKAANAAITAYDFMKNSSGITGMPWPWEALNDATGGIYPGEYYVLYGMPKSMKTWILLKILSGILFSDAHIGFLSGELRESKILSRLAAVILEVDATNVRRGTLDPDTEVLYKQLLLDLSNAPNLTFIDRKTPFDKLPSVASEYDVLFIDSAYRLSDSSEKTKDNYWKGAAKLSSALDDLSHVYGTTVIMTTQQHPREKKKAKDGGVGTMAFSMNFSYDADMIMEIVVPADTSTPERGLRFVTRDADVPAFTICARPAVDFYFRYYGLPATEDSSKKAQAEVPRWAQ
jgi:hypothetical protein